MKATSVAQCGGPEAISNKRNPGAERRQAKLPAERLGELFEAIRAEGYRVVGPTERNGAIVLDELGSVGDLPAGRTLRQGPGFSRVEQRADGAYFGYSDGPQSFKSYLFPPRLKLWSARRKGASFAVEPAEDAAPRLAFFGVRPCDLRAIEIQDRVFLEGDYVDPDYQRRREGVFIVAVNCTEPGDLCFCFSMGAGPEAGGGCGIVLTERVSPGEHWFLAEARDETGARVLESLRLAAATAEDVDCCAAALREGRGKMGRALDTDRLPELLKRNFDNSRWEQVAQRCLSCSNCTMVCPTCFCSTVEDTADLSGDVAERWRQWDSCFSNDFTYFTGGRARASTQSRYRQWLTHKLSSWIEQFDAFGCVGCGRCIAWCPVGIDITEEAAAIRATDRTTENG